MKLVCVELFLVHFNFSLLLYTCWVNSLFESITGHWILFRVAANGDTANKIGTYQIAILAQYHNVPFYIAAPSTSIDLTIASGKEITIEERPYQEMTHIAGIQVAASGNIKVPSCWS